MGKRFTRHEKWTPRVRFEHRVPLRQSEALKSRGSKYRRIVHEDIEMAEFIGYGRDSAAHRAFRTHVALDDERAASKCGNGTCCFFRLGPRCSVRNRNIGSGMCQSKSD